MRKLERPRERVEGQCVAVVVLCVLKRDRKIVFYSRSCFVSYSFNVVK